MRARYAITHPLSLCWIGLYLAVFVWSAINPADTLTWALEITPAAIGLVILALTFKHHPLTPLVYLLILIHAIILMIGGHYTYADVPLFEQWAEWTEGRNNYDKVGHFAQGFIPAMIAREILIRMAVINGRYWQAFFICCFCLAFSAFYELIEWWVALLSEQAADSFLGTQGYVWDTQSDMFLALLGAMSALLTLSRLHDRQLQVLRD
ncbi:DUF2238 domain-containing protein [Pontibacterium granulatum]|uniref:DUF2238 domain-containing protein n=1 Tax=Pontibacterium granulatum TaxID=2036029 RepID=UPI00249A8CBF|nr:DUF2238 domain-containing protein [Pontibacterium granulatum]MDI3325733.1 DUF2238 domain-containing protein [Pontibacterium granulatum]